MFLLLFFFFFGQSHFLFIAVNEGNIVFVIASGSASIVMTYLGKRRTCIERLRLHISVARLNPQHPGCSHDPKALALLSTLGSASCHNEDIIIFCLRSIMITNFKRSRLPSI
jgi:hypothetical protein